MKSGSSVAKKLPGSNVYHHQSPQPQLLHRMTEGLSETNTDNTHKRRKRGGFPRNLFRSCQKGFEKKEKPT